jgi:hypothetical protein
MTPDEAQKQYEEAMAALPPEVQEVMRQLRTHARPLPTVSELSRSQLVLLSPEDLEPAVVEYIAKLLETEDDRVAALGKFPRGVQVFYLSFLVEAEVANGGFHQFFWNSSSEFSELIAPALIDLGAPRAAEIFEQALAVAESEMQQQSVARSQNTLEAFASMYESTGLNQFDEPFSTESEAFPALRRQIIAEDAPTFFGTYGQD